MRVRWIRLFPVLVVAALAACGSERPTNAPSAHSITGHVRVTGFLVDANGAFAGTKVVGNADGIAVELLHGSQVVARTTTVGGVYTFTGLSAGDYIARSRVVGSIGDQTNTMVIAAFDVESADTIRLASRGELFPVPNPFTETTQIYFDPPDTMQVDMNVVGADGLQIRNLLSL